jgi:hypothetical protein
MIEGSLMCENCGSPLWQNPSPDATSMLEKPSAPDAFKQRVKWGTATFEQHRKVIIYVQGEFEPVELSLERPLLIGRKDEAANILPDLDLSNYGGSDKGVSRKHAMIQREDDLLSVIDLGSGNGTFLNGTRLSPNEPRILRDGDEVRLGKLALHVYYS